MVHGVAAVRIDAIAARRYFVPCAAIVAREPWESGHV
jgi:hypothetical protein